jgi:hypothetical protein
MFFPRIRIQNLTSPVLPKFRFLQEPTQEHTKQNRGRTKRQLFVIAHRPQSTCLGTHSTTRHHRAKQRRRGKKGEEELKKGLQGAGANTKFRMPRRQARRRNSSPRVAICPRLEAGRWQPRKAFPNYSETGGFYVAAPHKAEAACSLIILS